MDEELHIAELTPEFAAIREQARQFSMSRGQTDNTVVELPRSRTEADAAMERRQGRTEEETDNEEGPTSGRSVR